MVETGVLAEDAPYELLDGDLIGPSPQAPLHAVLVSRLRRRLERVWPDRYVREAQPVEIDQHSLPEPDIALILGGDADFVHRHPRGDEVELAVEVAVTSGTIDRAKALPYARAGVQTYWLLDVKERRLLVHNDPRPTGYGLVEILDEERLVSPPGSAVAWRVAELLG